MRNATFIAVCVAFTCGTFFGAIIAPSGQPASEQHEHYAETRHIVAEFDRHELHYFVFDDAGHTFLSAMADPSPVHHPACWCFAPVVEIDSIPNPDSTPNF